jgi:hypothetical protein
MCSLARSAALGVSSSWLPVPRGGASPPHSLSSGEKSTLPSPSQLCSRLALSSGVSVPVSAALAVVDSASRSPRLTGASATLEPEGFALGRLGLGFQKRVLVEHLLDLLRHFQRGQLQQPDGLLQLRRERQMLRNA